MASSFIEYKGDGFWIRDPVMEIVAAYIYVTIAKMDEVPAWLNVMNEHIRENSLGYFHSYMHFDLDEYLVDEERKRVFLKVVDETNAILDRKEQMLQLRELNDYLSDETDNNRWNGAIETVRLVKVLDFLRKLLMGELPIKVSDPIGYFF